MTRPTIDETYMLMAALVSMRSTCTSKHSVGAVVASKENFVIATGYNSNVKGQAHCIDIGCEYDSEGRCIRAVHAEMNALFQCAYRGVPVAGATMYVTHLPCKRCAKALIQSGIARVVFSIRTSSAQESRDLLVANGIVVSYLPISIDHVLTLGKTAVIREVE